MPLNRPALSLGAGPRGVQDARRWVVGAFNAIGRTDLVESAEVAVSELVTNALLHGKPPIQVRVRGTHEHPRVEVHDGSLDPPEMPAVTADDDLDGLLLTFGRGLNIVARASYAWGAEIEDDGKTVWFTPANDFSEDFGVDPLITRPPGPTGLPRELPAADLAEFHLNAVPIADFIGFQRHFRELRREVRLLALAHESDYPLAKDLAQVFDTVGRPFSLGLGGDEIVRAQDAGLVTTDLRVCMSRSHARSLDRFVDLLELTDEFCRAEKMMSLARTPRQRAFQNWFLSELVSQADGADPHPWAGLPDSSVERRSSGS